MLSNFAMLRTAFTAASLAVIMQPAAALHRVHSYHHASRAAVPVPPARRDTPSYDDPSRFGGDSAMGPEAASSSVAAVHVQPRGSGFAPARNEEKLVQRQLTDFNEMQRREDESFDRRLVICRLC